MNIALELANKLHNEIPFLASIKTSEEYGEALEMIEGLFTDSYVDGKRDGREILINSLASAINHYEELAEKNGKY
jgi:antitoxin component HigA of HigAB toxin-antitoxin module